MPDVDFDNIFGELEEKDARERKFMGLLATILPNVYFQLQKDGGQVFCGQGQEEPRLILPEALLSQLLQQGRFPQG